MYGPLFLGSRTLSAMVFGFELLRTMKEPGSLPCSICVTSDRSRLVSSQIGCVLISLSSSEMVAGTEIRLDAADVSDPSLWSASSAKLVVD